MPVEPNEGFSFESASSTPGVTLTGGPAGGSPILAVQVGQTVADLRTDVEANTTAVGNNATAIQSNTDDITELTGWVQRGTASISFTSQSSATLAVVFPTAFPGTPNVHVNINSGAGETGLWHARAIQLTPAGFVIFVFSTETDTWSGIPVGWSAIFRP